MSLLLSLTYHIFITSRVHMNLENKKEKCKIEYYIALEQKVNFTKSNIKAKMFYLETHGASSSSNISFLRSCTLLQESDRHYLHFLRILNKEHPQYRKAKELQHLDQNYSKVDN